MPRSPLAHSCRRRETHALTPRGSEGSRSGWEETIPKGPPLQVLMTGATLRPENPEGTEGHSRGAQLDPAAEGPQEQGLFGTKPTGRASVVMAEAPTLQAKRESRPRGETLKPAAERTATRAEGITRGPTPPHSHL